MRQNNSGHPCKHTHKSPVSSGTQFLKLHLRIAKNWQKKNVSEGWRKGSVVKSTSCSSRIPTIKNDFKSQTDNESAVFAVALLHTASQTQCHAHRHPRSSNKCCLRGLHLRYASNSCVFLLIPVFCYYSTLKNTEDALDPIVSMSSQDSFT